MARHSKLLTRPLVAAAAPLLFGVLGLGAGCLAIAGIDQDYGPATPGSGGGTAGHTTSSGAAGAASPGGSGGDGNAGATGGTGNTTATGGAGATGGQGGVPATGGSGGSGDTGGTTTGTGGSAGSGGSPPLSCAELYTVGNEIHAIVGDTEDECWLCVTTVDWTCSDICWFGGGSCIEAYNDYADDCATNWNEWHDCSTAGWLSIVCICARP